MKTTLQLLKNKAFSICISFIILAFVSCSKSENKETDTAIPLKGNVNLIIEGIEDYNESDIKIASTQKGSTQEPIKIDSYNGFDVITSVQISDPQINSKQTEKQASLSPSLVKKASTTRMGSNIQYRFLIYEGANTTPLVNQAITTGSSPDIKLTIGTTYKWVVYSINSPTVPTFTNNIIAKNDIANKDLLYASGNLTVIEGINHINVVLKRMTTQYQVNIDVRGMFGKLKDATKVTVENATGNLLQKANFDIINGSKVSGTFETFDTENNPLLAINGVPDRKSTTFYTMDESLSSANSLKINFSPLSLTMDDNSTSTFASTTLNLNHNSLSTATNPALTSTRGRKYTINAMLVESGIKVGTASTVWARSNLWYANLNDTTGKYRFRVSPFYRDTRESTRNTNSINYFTDPNDLWPYRASTPNGTSDDNIDPCSRVYPNNLWKMPIETDFVYLKNTTPISFYVIDRNDASSSLALLFPYKFLEYEIKYKSSSTSNITYNQPYIPNSTSSTSEDLVLSAIGYKNSTNNITERPVYTALLQLSAGNTDILSVAGGLSGGGFYWFYSQNNVLTPNLTNYFKFQYTKANLANLNLGIISLNLLSTNDVATNTLSGFSKDNKLNIPCVRNLDFQPAF